MAAVTVVLWALNVRCASLSGESLRTEAWPAVDVGSYTLILYGNRFYNDLKTIAFLDLEGDRYVFDPYAPAFDYRIAKGVPAREAFKKAEHFVSENPSFWRTQLSRIVDKRGNVIGYEVRPYYRPLAAGLSDVLDINYYLKNGKVRIAIQLKVPEPLLGGDGNKQKD